MDASVNETSRSILIIPGKSRISNCTNALLETSAESDPVNDKHNVKQSVFTLGGNFSSAREPQGLVWGDLGKYNLLYACLPRPE